MRNFFLFIQRYYHLFLFLFLEIISLYSIYQFNTYHHAVMLNSSNNILGKINEVNSNIMTYFSLFEENERLQKENIDLRKRIIDSYYVEHGDTVRMSDTSFKQKFTYIAGTVVQNSTDQANNYLIIDKGTANGVTKHMGVICPEGIVGVIVNVSENFSIAMSVLNSKFKVTPKLTGNTSIGRLIWDGNSPYFARIEGINRYNLIKKGDPVYTSPYSSIFPDNIKIGTVSESKNIQGTNLLDVKIRLSTRFTNLRSVYIVKNIQINEIKTLENETTIDN
ncbi:MAG: rod shape-determining protein MreC [Flavobacteriales bacterium]|nr:rod shape-determining protein MreC [Flavobacteriales bacterium]